MTRRADRLIEATAAQWFARLQDCEVTVDDMLAWQRWTRADARHTVAFNRIEAAWDAVQAVSPERVEALTAHTSRPSGGRRPFGLALAAAAVLAIVGLTWALAHRSAVPWLRPQIQILQTVVGQNRLQRLADGSQVTLGGDTRLEVELTTGMRRLRLTRGEALFVVARDLSRPFKVDAGDATVTATGTEFNIRRSDDRVIVAVVEGSVRVEPTRFIAPVEWLRPHSPARQPVHLDAGQKTIVGHDGLQSTAVVDDLATVTTWREGLLSFQREPLRYVLQDVNRYTHKPIFILDPAIGDLRITGTVISDNLGEWIGSLENAFGLRAVEEPERIVLTR